MKKKQLISWCSHLVGQVTFEPDKIPKGPLPTFNEAKLMNGSENAVEECEKNYNDGVKVSFAAIIRSRLEKFVLKIRPFVEAYKEAYKRLNTTTKSLVRKDMEKINKHYGELYMMIAAMEGKSEQLNQMIRQQLKTNAKLAEGIVDIFWN